MSALRLPTARVRFPRSAAAKKQTSNKQANKQTNTKHTKQAAQVNKEGKKETNKQTQHTHKQGMNMKEGAIQ